MTNTVFRSEAQALLDRLAKAYRAGDAAGCAACYTEDGAVYSPYAPPALGRAAVEELHREWVVDGENKSLEILAAECAGTLGWCLARFSEGDATGEGTSLNVLQRGPEGWLIRVSSLNGA